jgi:parvulin-like peptidyl-prolyl isomerase
MLEQLRRQSRSFIIWILFGIIIAVFIVSFGPQANPDSLGCGYSKDSALEVAGEELSMNSWRFAVNGLKRSSIPSQMRAQFAADLLVERELLAQAAEQHGFRVSDDMVNEAIAAGEFYILGYLSRVQDPTFWKDYKQLELMANDLGLSNVAQLAAEQRREQLAEMMRHLILRGSVSTDEVRQAFMQQNTLITVDYVKFDVNRYRTAVQLSEADLDRYVSAHEDEVKKAWEAEKAQWSSAKPRVLARHILISKQEAKKPEEGKKPEDGKKPDDGKKLPPAERAKQARERLVGGADFATVAREVSDDPSKARGGLLGWRPADSLGYGKELVEAAKKLEPGKVSDVVESERGFHIIRIEQRSDKGLTYEQKRQDLAQKLAPSYYAKALAKRDAERALAQAQTQPLDELFKRTKGATTGLPDNLPPEILQQLEQMQGKGLDIQPGPAQPGEGAGEPPAQDKGSAPDTESPPAPPASPGSDDKGDKTEPSDDSKQGLIVREGKTVLAQAGGAPPPQPPASQPPAQKGQAGAAPGTQAQPGAGKPGAPGKPGATDKPATDKPAGAAADEPLPEVEIDKPPLQSVGPVPRLGDSLAGIGESKKMTSDLFEKLEVGKLAPEVYEVGNVRGPGGGDGFAIVMLKSRKEADLAKFEQERARIGEELTYGARNVAQGEAIWGKNVVHLSAWIRKRCESTSQAGEIRVSREIFNEGAGDDEAPVPYQPCATMGDAAVAGQLSSRLADGP